MSKTIAQLNKEIAALQAEAKKLYAVERKGVVAKVNELIAKHSLAPSDLKWSSNASPALKSPSVDSAVGTARYGDGKGNTWGGRGPRPAWLRSALEAGESLESFQRAGDRVAETPQPAMAGPAHNRAVGKRPAKFKDAQGNSWSGRGSRPRWLQAALKKRGAKIEDFLIDRSGLPTKPASTTAPAAAAAKPLSPKTQPRRNKSAQAAKSTSVKTVGASKGSPVSVPGAGASGKESTSPAIQAVAAPRASKSKPTAKAAAKKRGSGASAKAAVKSSTAASVAKPAVKAAPVSAAKRPATPAPAKKAAVKKPASKSIKRPEMTNKVTGQADTPSTPLTAALGAASEVPTSAN